VIEYDDNGATVTGKRVEFAAFPVCVRAHLEHVPSTREIEAVAIELVARAFQHGDVVRFVRAVCKWGGYAGIAGRVMVRNEPSGLAAAFRRAAADVGVGVDVAVQSLLDVHSLGVSFGSKHLRFLAPRVCGILDAKMAKESGFQKSAAGVARYSALCCELARRLERRRVPNPMNRGEGGWYAADVDMALFAIVQRWAP